MEAAGAMRKYQVELSLACAIAKVGKDAEGTEMSAPGSTHLTSDYDVTLVGPRAPEVMWLMFKEFHKQYKTTLPQAFDTNLYCGGIYRFGPRPPAIKEAVCINPNKGMWIVLPSSLQQHETCRRYVRLKMLQAGHLRDKDTQALFSALTQEARAVGKRHTRSDKRPKQSFVDMVGRYKLHGDIVARIRDKNMTGDALVEEACRVGFFEEEAYIAPSTIAAVVVEMQMGIPIQLSQEDYLTAAMENAADFLLHARHAEYHHQQTTRQKLLHLSKYIHRCFVCLSKAGKTRFKKKAEVVGRDIVSLRGRGDASKVKGSAWRVIGYSGGTLSEFCRSFVRMVC